ncbi:MAG TPA: Gfo/Idh/MocA family oxidoreductase [Acidimicrobiales bacterium]|nr:Gfo/Idh/MocA family oxidoreductase [Acidimicrobiales bacterium]
MAPLRIGVLGAARIAPAAIVRPARAVEGVEVVAIAARDRRRARAFADRQGIARVVDSYEELVTDPGIDAIYNPLPNGLHGRWTMAAMAAGKHVLCEKPFTANAEEARAVAAAHAGSSVVLMEAFHYRYHPLFARVRELMDSGAVGTVRHLEAWLCFPLLSTKDIRWNLALAGGATMDAGCYPIHMVRHLGDGEPEVSSARARLRSPGVDRFMEADLRFAGGVTGRIVCSMLSSQFLRIGLRVRGDDGEIRVLNPLAPDRFHRLTVRTKDGKQVEHFTRRHTYDFQLEAFLRAAAGGGAVLTGPDDAMANMVVIDAVYRAAGLEPRQPTA